RYLAGVVTGRARRYAGHNPGTSWMTLAVWLLMGALVVTGVKGEGSWEDIHEIAAYLLLATIGLHLAGLALHSLRHRDAIAWAMVDGREAAPPEAALASAGAWLGALCAAVALIGAIALFRGFDAKTGSLALPLGGPTLQLGESE